MKELIDLTGQRFGKLTVIKRYGTDKHSKVTWLCQCDCGKEAVVIGSDLKRGHSKSCGCSWKRNNTVIFKENYVEVYTVKGDMFLVDTDDYEKIKEKCWHMTKHGYISTHEGKKEIKLHRFITNCPSGMLVDHINQNKADNRKCNLRIVNHSQNNMNKPIQKNNTTSATGVFFRKANKKWIAKITIKGISYYLGSFALKEDAIVARKKAEIKYFGDYRYGGTKCDYD